MKILLGFALSTSLLLSGPVHAQNSVVLVGSGSTVPAPLYNRWTQEYGKRKSNIQLRYLPVGTSEGNQANF
jgi:ABC-type phosphate transport system substrate-binding protein